MDLRQLTPELSVTPQVLPEEVAELAKAGVKVLINNRPDEEVTADMDSDVMRAAAEAAGMVYVFNPFTPGQITPDMVELQAEALALEGPAVAYCRSGNRSTVLWALANAGQIPAEQLVETAANVGYDISGVLPLIDALSRGR